MASRRGRVGGSVDGVDPGVADRVLLAVAENFDPGDDQAWRWIKRADVAEFIRTKHGFDGTTLEAFLHILPRLPGVFSDAETHPGEYRVPLGWARLVRHRRWRYNLRVDVATAEAILNHKGTPQQFDRALANLKAAVGGLE